MAATLGSDGREGLTAETWWAVDRSHEPRLTVGATPLVERCIRTHGWDEAFALGVLDGYRKFLTLKQMFDDWEAEKLSPSIPVDQMWHQHLIDNRNYAKDCALLFGRVIYHDPDGGLDTEGRNKRIKDTKSALRLKFGEEYDEQVWNFGIRLGGGEDEERARTMRDQRAASRARSSENVPSHSSSPGGAVSDDYTGGGDRITILLRDQTGELTFFKIKTSIRMGAIFEYYAQGKGVQRADLDFLLDGEKLTTDDQTPRMLQLDDQDQIDVMLDQCGC